LIGDVGGLAEEVPDEDDTSARQRKVHGAGEIQAQE
jgi:hypothetical protein